MASSLAGCGFIHENLDEENSASETAPESLPSVQPLPRGRVSNFPLVLHRQTDKQAGVWAESLDEWTQPTYESLKSLEPPNWKFSSFFRVN